MGKDLLRVIVGVLAFPFLAVYFVCMLLFLLILAILLPFYELGKSVIWEIKRRKNG